MAYASIAGVLYAAATLFTGCGALAISPFVGASGGAVLGPSVAHEPAAGSLTCLLHKPVRKALKGKHGITVEENDTVLAMCCDFCILCQELREIDLRRKPVYVQMTPMMNPAMGMPTMGMPMQPVQPMQMQPMVQQQARPGY